jgi:hypothetical protein
MIDAGLLDPRGAVIGRLTNGARLAYQSFFRAKRGLPLDPNKVFDSSHRHQARAAATPAIGIGACNRSRLRRSRWRPGRATNDRANRGQAASAAWIEHRTLAR